jgi:methionyl-tRNA formyltransferase
MSAAPGAMRIVLASMGAEEFALLHATCEQAGHVPVAYACSRSMRPDHPADPYAVNAVGQLLGALPSGMDLLLPAGPAGLGDALAGYRPDLLVIYGFNWILPPAVFGLPRFGAINIHTSLLPRYRGPAPVLWAIRHGDPDIGVTVHRIDEGIDTGPILAQRGGIPLDDDITPDRLRSRLAPVVRDLLATALARVASGAPGRPQPDVDTSYARFLEPDFSEVDWSRPAREIHNQVRVFRYMGRHDAPVARVGESWLRLVRTSLTPANGLRVECEDGPIWIVESTPAAPPVMERPVSG